METTTVIKKRVKKITIKQNRDTYDLTTTKNHNFFGNKTLLHNSEIILRPNEFCNLSEVVVRPKDSLAMLQDKVMHATILGCLQATLTNFKFLNEDWKNNCEEERLLGVSLTGICDHPVLSNGDDEKMMAVWLDTLKSTAEKTARKWSKILDIEMPAAITCVKPSGTVSQLVDSASGLHPRYAPFYVRRVRVSKVDPVAKYLMDKGVKAHPDNGYKTIEEASTVVFDFPIKAPEHAVFRNEKSAIQQLNHWKVIQEHWCEHKPSCTVYVKDDEWLEVGAWVYKNWDIVSGISFLPYDNGVYKLAPYEEITEAEYNDRVKEFPLDDLDFDNGLLSYESSDYTEGAKEYACKGGSCEIV